MSLPRSEEEEAVALSIMLRDEVLAAVRSSKTLKEAGEKLGVTRARVSYLCDARGINWYANRKMRTGETT